MKSRREFLHQLGGLTMVTVGSLGGISILSNTVFAQQEGELWFKISLAEWSLHKALFAKKINNLDFPSIAKNTYGIDAVEYVNIFFKDKAQDTNYLSELKKRCDDLGVRSVLIMCDGEGDLGDAETQKRNVAVENHYKWAEAAKFLGCHSIRVNAKGNGTAEEVSKKATEGLRKLSEYALSLNINVIVENHGGYSSDGKWLSNVIQNVGMPNCGTLPDFGNFCLKNDPKDWKVCYESYDRYTGTEELMPFAKGVSAKSYEFSADGECIEIDYKKMLSIVKKAGYKGYIGIEYEGSLSEDEGIKKTKALLQKYGKQN
ncbi:MAG: sugar phosphate isomerase/epimerase family protein [Chitinophagaceae bacterium]|nr:sugar phosphate isomerase/epimerase family protein [Chitinophagaceae bacterium]